ncbi:MAG: STAS domain-containing protein [Propionivibrio sp.]
MIARPAAVPRQTGARESASSSGKPGQAAPQEKTPTSAEVAKAAAVPETPPSDFSDFKFSQSSLDFQIEAEVDPVDAQAEEAAVLFANNQDKAAQGVLENALPIHRSGPAERLWLMLFDLYRMSGQQQAFEAMEIEYARAFEKSPPGWRSKAAANVRAPESAAGSVMFKGDLVGSNTTAFEVVRQALEKNRKMRLDLSKVKQIDPEGCGCLLNLLVRARKNKGEIELLGREALGELVQGRVETGKAEGKECWLLLLELCQLQGRQEAFEEVAIDYAVTFEESPPSWEAGRVAAPEPVVARPVVALEDARGDAYILSGEIKSSRFGDLASYANVHDPVLIDCAELTRMDFISAGALLNALTAIRSSGKQIVFRHPNHLVAELFGVVGLKAVASIVFSKQ